MILIDPQLKSDSPLQHASAKPSAAARRTKPLRLPSTPSLARTLAQFLKRAQAAVPLRGRVTVLLTSDATMQDLNRRFRGKNTPTDVLSFPASNLVQNQKKNQEKGDEAISMEMAIRQSVEQGHSLGAELKVLMLHGLLHLAGFDHETDAGEMQRRERGLRAKLGLPLGLIERAASLNFSQRTRKRGAPGRKATTGPSTPAAKTAFAQDDKAKRAPKPKKNGRESARDPRTPPVHRSRTDTERRRKP